MQLALLAAATIITGLAIRFAIPGLPWIVWKYAGSMLWASLIYFLAAFAFPKTSRLQLLALTFVVVTAVEFSRLYHAPWLDTFRISLAGKLILGKIFSMWNLPAYYAGLLLAFGIDRTLGGRG